MEVKKFPQTLTEAHLGSNRGDCLGGYPVGYLGSRFGDSNF